MPRVPTCWRTPRSLRFCGALKPILMHAVSSRLDVVTDLLAHLFIESKSPMSLLGLQGCAARTLDSGRPLHSSTKTRSKEVGVEIEPDSEVVRWWREHLRGRCANGGMQVFSSCGCRCRSHLFVVADSDDRPTRFKYAHYHALPVLQIVT